MREPSIEFEAGDLTNAQAFELLEELELNRPEEVEEAREHAARSISCPVRIRAGNVCDRTQEPVPGTCRELQRFGFSCVLKRPLMVGSVFRVELAREEVDVPPTLAVCDRCIMLDDTAFEVHLRVDHQIALPRGTKGTEDG